MNKYAVVDCCGYTMTECEAPTLAAALEILDPSDRPCEGCGGFETVRREGTAGVFTLIFTICDCDPDEAEREWEEDLAEDMAAGLPLPPYDE